MVVRLLLTLGDSLFRYQIGHENVVVLHGDILRYQAAAAQQHGGTAHAGQIAVIVAAAVAQTLPFGVTGAAGDNGQVEVSKILSSVFNALLPNPIFRKVMPAEYKLFQAADLLCTLELVKLKLENNMFSKSEKSFFGNIRDLKKNYLKPLSKKEWS